MNTVAWLVAVLVLGVGCGPKRPPDPPQNEGGTPQPAQVAIPDAPWTVTYGDGSGNVYKIWSEGETVAYSYDPVTPEESSSGRYSGGEARAGKLDRVDVETLWQRLHELETDVVQHTTERAMLTGAFTIEDPSGTREFIVEPSEVLNNFDAFLAGLK